MVHPVTKSELSILIITFTITFFVKNSTSQDSTPSPSPPTAPPTSPSPETVEPSPTTPAPLPIVISEIKINLGDPCNFSTYQKFVIDTEIHNISHVLTSPNFTYIDNLKDICIGVSTDSVVDAHEFDCVLLRNTSEICICGYNMDKVDPLFSSKGKIVINGLSLITYMTIHNLNRRLSVENGKCLSSTHGHCTTSETRPEEMKLKCREKHVCKNTKLKIENQNNSEEYWTCEKDGEEIDFLKGAAKSISDTGFDSTFLFVVTTMVMVIITSNICNTNLRN